MFQKTLGETPAERARHYRALAMTAESEAAATPLPALRAVFLRSADRWHRLAALMELGSDYTPRKIAPRPARQLRKANVATEAARPGAAQRAPKQTTPIQRGHAGRDC